MGSLHEIFKSKKATVIGVIPEAPDCKTIILKLEENYTADPGQFNILYYWGIGEVPISLSNLPVRKDGYVVLEHTVRAVGTVTNTIVYNVKTGLILGLRGPFGRGWPLHEYEGLNVLVIAGGIGIAPLRPLIKYILKNRERYGDVYILYGAKAPEHLLYKYELESYSKATRTKLLLSSDTKVEGWTQHVGVVTDLINYIKLDPKSTATYICGPEVMMRIAVKKLLEIGFRKDKLHLSMERRMRCGVGVCGTCQLGHFFVCTNGPVFSFEEIEEYFWVEGI